MALIKTGGLIAEIRGSVGGATFARNRGGAYVRNRSIPINPASVRQVAVRSVFADLTQLWGTVLTPAQRDAWNVYAENVPLINALGEPRQATGLNHYVRSNSLLLDVGGTRVDDAPTTFNVGPTITPTLTINATADTFSVTDLGGYTLGASATGLLLSVGRPQSPGVNFYRSPFQKSVGILAVATSNEPPYADNPLPQPVAAGQALFIRTATVLADGRVGVPVVQRFLVA